MFWIIATLNPLNAKTHPKAWKAKLQILVWQESIKTEQIVGF